MPIHTSAISGSTAGSDAVTTQNVVDGTAAGSMTGNSASVSQDLVLPAYYNAILYGPITIDSNSSFTIGANSNVKIKDFDDV
tara:strand:- start:2178 stop:2423 length:246 start_codon:yes stop_codon:yes gene_type:complete